MAQSALPSNALYDVQRYLRQRRATGAQITPQNERAAWSGYFDALEANRFGEAQLELQRNRQRLIEKQMQQEEDASQISGVGQLVSAVGQGGMLLKGTDLGAKIGLGGPTAPAAGTPTATGGTVAATGAAPATAGGAATMAGGAAPTTAALTPASAGASEAGLAGGMSASAASSVAPEVGSAGIMSAAGPYLGPASAGWLAGTTIPGLLGKHGGMGEKVTGVASGAVAGAAVGAAMTSWSGPGAIVGGVIGAIAGGVGAAVK